LSQNQGSDLKNFSYLIFQKTESSDNDFFISAFLVFSHGNAAGKNGSGKKNNYKKNVAEAFKV
jgi:hypothetical protein